MDTSERALKTVKRYGENRGRTFPPLPFLVVCLFHSILECHLDGFYQLSLISTT